MGSLFCLTFTGILKNTRRTKQLCGNFFVSYLQNSYSKFCEKASFSVFVNLEKNYYKYVEIFTYEQMADSFESESEVCFEKKLVFGREIANFVWQILK